MEWFTFQPSEEQAGRELFAEEIPVQQLASQYGTPLYVYSRKALEVSYQAYHQAMADWSHLICYAVKANSNLAVLNVLARLGGWL